LKVYIAGPMTGLRDYNYPQFFGAACQLALLGFQPLNPATIGQRPDYEYTDYIKAGIGMMLEADGVALLDGWENSNGASLERNVAVACGLYVDSLREWIVHPNDMRLRASL